MRVRTPKAHPRSTKSNRLPGSAEEILDPVVRSEQPDERLGKARWARRQFTLKDDKTW
jgi:hypothetical protein